MKKAFTLIELLAVIAILGIIGLITTLSVNKIIKINKQKLYDAEVVNIIEAAKLYYTDHTEYLPSNNTSTCVSLKRLQDNKLIDKNINNPVTGNSFIDTFAVTVKNDNNSYDYDVSNTCDSTMMAYSSSKAYWQEAYRANISNVTFLNTMDNVPTTCDYTNNTLCWDVSNKQDKSIIAYLQANTIDNTKYDLFIVCKGQIYFNENSSIYFDRMENLEYINNLNKVSTEYVKDMSSMFYDCKLLTSLDLSTFDTSKVTSMYFMFNNCYNLTMLNVNKWDTSNVTNMGNMFYNCEKLTSLDLSNFDTSEVTNMSSMLGGLSSIINLDLSGFDTSNVTNMSAMFQCCFKLKSINLSSFNTSNVTNMNYMFGGNTLNSMSLLNLDLSTFDTSNVTDMGFMFDDCKLLTSLDLSTFDTSKVTSMYFMFSNCSSLTSLNLSNFDTLCVTDMRGMFGHCSKLTLLDLSSFETSSLIKTGNLDYDSLGMFNNCTNLTTIYVGSGWNVSNVTDSTYMFYNCTKLPNFNSTVIDKTNAFAGTGGYLTLKA